MFREYLNTLKAKGNFTCAEISKLSGFPEATIRKILSGDTADPRFETVVKLAASMGGSIADMAGDKKASEIEANAVITLKDAYESRIAELKQDKKILTIVAVALGVILFGILVLDLMMGNHGWVRY